jgi:hypothetical protein
MVVTKNAAKCLVSLIHFTPSIIAYFFLDEKKQRR